MNKMSRNLSTTERVLLIVLALMLIGIAYYYLVHQSVAKDTATYTAKRDALTDELVMTQKKLKDMREMEADLEKIGDVEKTPRMESYNNSRAEIGLLNDILTASRDYSVNFSSVSRNGNQIRRSFTLSFTTDSFDTAKKIISDLANSRCRCLIGDVSYKPQIEENQVITDDETGVKTEKVESVNVTLIATFYETLVGGTEDSGLPADGETRRK
jgi:cell shape-determining protein MreC